MSERFDKAVLGVDLLGYDYDDELKKWYFKQFYTEFEKHINGNTQKK